MIFSLKNPAFRAGALAAAALLAAAGGHAMRTDGQTNGNRIAWDDLTAGGGAAHSAANDYLLVAALGNVQALTSSSPDNAFRLTPGMPVGAAIPSSSGGNPGTSGSGGSGGGSQPAAWTGGVYAYPVPYRASRDTGGIRFAGLTGSGTVKVYTLDGDLVRTLDYSGGSLVWNPVTNDGGSPLASNAYLYRVDGGQKVSGRLLVVR